MSPPATGRTRRRRSHPAALVEVEGPARVGRRTKELVNRIEAGDVAVIDHEDLDPVAAESLLKAGVHAVVNAAASVSGRYPNRGPLILTSAGVVLVDRAGPEVMDAVADGQSVTLEGGDVRVDGQVVARGVPQTSATLTAAIQDARQTMGAELARFAENTLGYIQSESHLLLDELEIPDIRTDLAGRHALIVVRGSDFRDDLEMLRRGGYMQEMQPVLIGVDGGADALLEMGLTPDLIIGDFDSVSETALRSGAELVVHAYRDGRAPGAARLEDLGLEYLTIGSEGTSEDIAMLLAWERGAELIVAVGTHSSMADFLDKGRAGMASTFLVRLKVGPILVDAKGVSRLYRHQVRKRDLGLLVAAALITIVIIFLVSEPLRVIIRGYLLTF
ncbi:putative cytokinetic ring protein SteA [Actinomarinicola tropica]|uniref:Uncharacterized protein n=1 Tax=Actinomarinicola tropica TaxID=2789776 RepID=A0A5Q2RHH3_9ACTN|nr:putative cytokinetic ring protein SteA [Actinomarinicola tropica]QGG95223.1 hypothetical protein GH723_09025 [Actinomarinicola tropica]